jgi:hypothetical protein
MPDWFTDTPYDLLGIERNTSKKQVTTAYNKAIKGKDKLQQKALSEARDKLERSSKRILVDAFLPDLESGVDEQALVEQLTRHEDESVDWLSFIDTDAIFVHDTRELLSRVTRMTFTDPIVPEGVIRHVERYSGLDDFAKELGL